MKLKLFVTIFKRNWQLIVVLFLAIAFFIGTSYFNYSTQSYGKESSKRLETLDFVKWLSPDETANYVFSKLYAQQKVLAIPENYNLYAKDIIMPRSFRSDSGILKPVSFLGIILIYGKIGQIFGYKVIPYLTPFFASLGLIFFYLLIRKIFNKSNAFISTVLLTSFPPFVYYSARSMFHNVLFLVLLIIGLYFSTFFTSKSNSDFKFFEFKIRWQSIKGMIFALLSGYFVGLSITVRTSELLWILPLLFFLWIFNITRVNVLKIVLFCCSLLFALLPVFYYNQILYGSPFFGGYNEMNKSIVKISQVSSELVEKVSGKKEIAKSNMLKTTMNVVFQFGMHPKQSSMMVDKYFVKMFPWLLWLAAVGIVIFLLRFKKIRKKQFIFLSAWLLSSFVLIIYYGSWEFHDNPNPNHFTIGNSYTRYWLPVYLGALPFASLFILQLTWFFASLLKFPKKLVFEERWTHFKIRRYFFAVCLRLLIVAFITYISMDFILFGSDEGLIASATRQRQSQVEWKKVLELTEGNSIIITTYHDKLFFPERKVIVGLFSDLNMVKEYANLVNFLPVYYYNFSFSEKDFSYLNNSRLKSVGLQIKEIQKVSTDFTLYQLQKSSVSKSSRSL